MTSTIQSDFQEGIFKTSDGCSIAFRLREARNADAARIVLIHSLALDGSIWHGVPARLANHAPILTYDCRGHGKSERRAGSSTPPLFPPDLSPFPDHSRR